MKALAEAWEEALEGLVAHEDRHVVYLNPVAARLLGVTREKVMGRPLLLALRDHRLEALALHGGERLLEVRDASSGLRPFPGGSTSWTRARPKGASGPWRRRRRPWPTSSGPPSRAWGPSWRP